MRRAGFLYHLHCPGKETDAQRPLPFFPPRPAPARAAPALRFMALFSGPEPKWPFLFNLKALWETPGRVFGDHFPNPTGPFLEVWIFLYESRLPQVPVGGEGSRAAGPAGVPASTLRSHWVSESDGAARFGSPQGRRLAEKRGTCETPAGTWGSLLDVDINAGPSRAACPLWALSRVTSRCSSREACAGTDAVRVRSQASEVKWSAQDSPAAKQGLAPGVGMDGPEGEESEAPSAGKSFLQKQGSRRTPPWQEQRAGGQLPFMGPTWYSGEAETALCLACARKL